MSQNNLAVLTGDRINNSFLQLQYFGWSWLQIFVDTVASFSVMVFFMHLIHVDA